MKFSSALYLALLATVASASPLIDQDLTSSITLSAATGTSVGAAYFITNLPTGNQLIAAEIGANGKLTLRKAVGTGGLGAHGITDPFGPDALFTQGAIQASVTGNIVATVNPGSHTISLFRVNASDPADVKMIGKPVKSGGEFPVSLAINKLGDTVCSLNGGAINGVSCFKVDPVKGLVAIPDTLRLLNLKQTTPATGPAGTASHVVFSEDNKRLIVSVKGVPPTPGYLAVWEVACDGSLSKNFQTITPAKGGLLPFSLTVIPGRNAVLATDPGIGFDIFDLASKGMKSSAVAIDGQGATCWSSYSPMTKNFFLTDLATSTVTEVSVDSELKGQVVKQYPQGEGSGTIDNDIVTIGKKDFMYVLSANATSIDVLSLDAPGKARNIQRLDIMGPAKAAGVKLDRDYLQGMTTFIRK